MSCDVMSRGIIMPLISPVKDREELTEKLYEEGSCLQINYEGTLVYSDEGGQREDAYGLHIGVPNPSGAMMAELRKYGLKAVTTQARPYHCLWYNGADSDMNMLTKEEFLRK